MEVKKNFGVFVNVTIDTDKERVFFDIAGRKAYFPLHKIKMNLEKEGFTSWELNVTGSGKEEFAVLEQTGLEIMDWIELAQRDIEKIIHIHNQEQEGRIREKAEKKSKKKKPLKKWQKIILWIGAIGFIIELFF